MSNEMIPKAQPDDKKYLGKGVHLVQFTKVEHNNDQQGNPLISRGGYKSFKFYMKDRQGVQHVDIIYYGAANVQWVLDGLMKAIGVDTSTEEAPPSEALGKMVFVVIGETRYVDQNRKQLQKDNGDPRIFANRIKYIQVVDESVPPTISEDKLIDYKVEVQAVAPEPQASDEAPWTEEKTAEPQTPSEPPAQQTDPQPQQQEEQPVAKTPAAEQGQPAAQGKPDDGGW